MTRALALCLCVYTTAPTMTWQPYECQIRASLLAGVPVAVVTCTRKPETPQSRLKL